ncbi:DUF1801 domain-containing protein [Fibrella forsythiae]|uniref:DUF1801 domain-containing protein n=1 Tax=Fibrella forsythiae TaxID=2817061 RepID=A0ABS3JLX1_9BACT|nr:DUF1801 domain-containing protein [Fibrella forsythiae]MBO0951007.1 DUF1801 domain-containing protein [Fibrella forsythiae]
MKPTSPLTDQKRVTDYIAQLAPEIGGLVETLRQIILQTDPTIGEQIKWNNPGFYYTGEMKPFDPKAYKRDMAVFNLHKGRVMLVLPGAASLPDPAGLLEGAYQDGRRTISFTGMNEVAAKAAALQVVLTEWLKRVEK